MKVFRSIRFNIYLGAAIAFAAALGTMLPQIPESPEKVSAFQQAHAVGSRVLGSLGLFNVYQSPWFVGMLALMAFDIIVCKLWNRPTDAKVVALPPELTREERLERQLSRKEDALKGKPFQASFPSPVALDLATMRAKKALAGRRFHLRDEVVSASGRAFVATRHRAQRWGSYLAHVGLVVILVGALIKSVWGFVEMVPVLEGGSRALQNKPDWEVYVDKFTVRYYEGTRQPKFFSSDLTVRRGGAAIGAKVVTVNDPLDIGGVRFYQASWGAGGMFRSVALRLGGRELLLRQRVPTRVPGTPFEVEADVMMPDFVSQGGQAGTASLDLRNPAVRFAFSVAGRKTSPLWLFLNDPDLVFIEDADGTLSRAPAPPFALTALDPVLFSGIQVAYDPGYRVVIAGALMWLAGVIGLFYLHRRRLWVLIEPDGRGSAVSVGGWSSRGPQEFEAEFLRLMEHLSRRLDAPAGRTAIFRRPIMEVPS